MATYQVGEEGATVFSVSGEPIVTLVAGQVVVPGSIDTPGSAADQYRKREQRRGYETAVIRPERGPMS